MRATLSTYIHAILYAVKNKATVEGSTLYVTLSPCLACARVIYTAGVEKVIYLISYAEYKGIASDEGVDFLRKFGVAVEKYDGQIEHVTELI
ncbi:cytidine/deoxycytidylate deaminase-like protein [Marinoscillum furvescens DSM 4134]|uniref:Cytidine/deoxycytidylate deaminase-like protein n=1 Tax=Marinoscillum furvescens DSM 4134 TaxID=1122208 RepID=A0A3D9KVU5_MARFU|nr:cytidine/deoxycytidylate deaminase-like protein [Marinoscillum furvescens DSM 4134]